MTRRRPRSQLTNGCTDTSGDAICRDAPYVVAKLHGGDPVRLCMTHGEQHDAAGLLQIGSARRILAQPK